MVTRRVRKPSDIAPTAGEKARQTGTPIPNPTASTVSIGGQKFTPQEAAIIQQLSGIPARGSGGVPSESVLAAAERQQRLRAQIQQANQAGVPVEQLQERQAELDVLNRQQGEALTAVNTQSVEELAGLQVADNTRLQAAADALPKVASPFGFIGEDIISATQGENPFGQRTQAEQDAALLASGVGLGVIGVGASAPAATAALASIKSASVATAGLAGFSLSSVINSLTSGRISDLEGDIAQVRATSSSILRNTAKAPGTGGIPPEQSLEILQQQEQELRAKIGELHLALQRSPKDRLAGRTAQETARRALTDNLNKQFAVRRFMIDGDVNALLASAGNDDLIQES